MPTAARPETRSARRTLSDRFMTRLVNPVTRRVLASPLHDLMSEGVVLLLVTGRRSGRLLQVPVNYLADDGRLTVVTHRRRRWWRNLASGAPLRIVLRGEERNAWAWTEDAGEAEVTELLTRLYARSGHTLPAARAEAMARDRVVVAIDVLDAARPEGSRHPGLWRRWTVAVTAGEAVGFVVPVLAGTIGTVANLPAPAGVALLLAAGLVEGTVLGGAQALALRPTLPGVRSRDWIRATALGAVAAYGFSFGMLWFGERSSDSSSALFPAGAVVLGAGLLASIGVLQWRVLRSEVPRAGHWIWITAVSWAAALTVFLGIATPLWHEGQATLLIVAIGAGAGLAMAAVAAAVSGAGLAWLCRSRNRT